MPELIILILICTFIILANGTVCWLFYSRPRLHKKPENGLFCSQAFGDLLNVVFTALYIFERQGLITADKLAFLLNYILFLSSLGLCALTFDRYWSITKPLQRHCRFDHRFLAVELILIWVLPLAPSMMNLAPVLRPKAVLLNKILYCSMMTVLAVLFVTLVILHICVYIHVRNIRRTDPNARAQANKNELEMTSTESPGTVVIHRRNTHVRNLTMKEEISLAKMTLIMLVIYFVGHMPTIYLNMAQSFERFDLITNFTVQFPLYSFLMNSFINPLLCILVKCDFKSAFRDWLPCFREKEIFSRL